MRPRPGGARIALSDGRTLHVDHAVLALGNVPPACPGAFDRRIITNPWVPGGLDGLDGQAHVLIVGSGLTAVDVVVSLRRLGHRGQLTAVSRTGLLPRTHSVHLAAPAAACVEPGDVSASSARGLLHAVRAASKRADDWRPVVDGLRPVTIDLWRGLSLSERERFVRHASRWWDVHRHRMAPQIGAIVDAALADGGLQIMKGSFQSVRPSADGVVATIGRSGERHALEAGAVVMCTGPRQDVDASPLVRHLVETGAARPGPLHLGLDVSADGRVLDRKGHPHARLWALGTARRGAEWECTAVPELRRHASELAEHLLGPTERAPVRRRGR